MICFQMMLKRMIKQILQMIDGFINFIKNDSMSVLKDFAEIDYVD